MPVADYSTYCRMLERARAEKFAYPAVNVTSMTTANAVLKGLAESGSDGIIQVSTGGGAFASGTAVKDMALGGMSIAEHVHRVADRYPIHVALHTDHCQADKLDTFVLPLVQETERRRASGQPNLFTMHVGNFYIQLASERDRPRVLDLVRSHMRPEQRMFVGVIDPIDPQIETPEQVRDRVLEAAAVIPVDRLGTTDGCGFAPFADDTSTARRTAFARIQARVLGTELASRVLGV